MVPERALRTHMHVSLLNLSAEKKLHSETHCDSKDAHTKVPQDEILGKHRPVWGEVRDPIDREQHDRALPSQGQL